MAGLIGGWDCWWDGPAAEEKWDGWADRRLGLLVGWAAGGRGDVNTMSETAIRSREEDAELQRSTKKVKEHHSLGLSQSVSTQSSQEGSKSYKEKLLGEMPGAFEQAFSFGISMDTEAESDDEFPELPIGEKAVKFSGSTKTRIRAPWTNALIVKVFGKTVGYHFLHSRITSMWKPIGRMDCVDLGNDLFLIKFQVKEDYARVLREGL
ncbi:hypothetical protein SO802_016305 [Lithocarpus litseifolius]|uniref:DUF4283 domain-containing protein n=1 Tax=Lithocarpus litseifolius TaxID=425828 RepID=A0AAW2CXM2_9ROSI